MGKFILNLGLLIFLIFSVVIVYLYFGLLWEKIYKPNYKNLSIAGFVIVAFPILGMLVADFFIVRRLWRSIVNEIRAVKKEI